MGVGAYFRPVSEVRKHNVKFTSECLGFANIPIESSRNKVLNGQIPVTHHPKWKERTPRDTGTGWDFEDVRDFYLKQLFSLEPVLTRSFENEKYLAVSEVVTGEVMTRVFSEWRSKHSHCAGGLVWFLKDLWLGAGWGIIDSLGSPKACYYYLKRIWQPINVFMTDESLNGLDIHIINETDKKFDGEIFIEILKANVQIQNTTESICMQANTSNTLQLDKILDNFYDVTYSYRFGPPKHDVVAVHLKDMHGKVVNSAFYFPNWELPEESNVTNCSAELREADNGVYLLKLLSDDFLFSVRIDAPGYSVNDNFFHLSPSIAKYVTLYRVAGHTKACKGFIESLNSVGEIRFKEN